ncbi:MAG: V0D/AC39 family V-type ATPase subunit [Candidatus Merdivicinus sp.]|jgi:V/A-type H+-transporting ATPase subunit C
MLNSCSSNAILTKIRAMLGKRLTQADYAQMARKNDVGEVAALLRENPSYEAALRNVEESSVHRGQLEALLKKDLFYKYSALRRYDFSGGDFYDFIIVQTEIDEILRKLVLMQSGELVDFVVDLPSYMLGKTSFSLMALAKAKNFEEMLACMPHTPYPSLLQRFAQQDIREVNILDCENALYTYYYQYLTDTIRKQFRGAARKELLEAVSLEVESLNIQMIFRMKIYFHLQPEVVRRYLYPYSYRIKKAQLEDLLKADGFEEMCAVLRMSADEKSRISPADGIEPYTHRLCARLEGRLLRFTTSAPVAMYTFFTLRRIEVENIITVIEGVRYRLPQEEIMQMLIL